MRQNIKDFSPVAMTIAGSDSGGGAGIQADIKTFAHFGIHGTSAVTAITAQNPCEVRRIDPLPPISVKTQIETVFAKFAVGAIKTGMLFSPKIIETVAETLSNTNAVIVVDPVMVATSGAMLLKKSAIKSLQKFLLPLADWITPNIPEAEILANIQIKNLSDMAEAAKICSHKWNCGCIVKGGHLGTEKLRTDIVSFGKKIFALSSPSAGKDSLHGTGCSFSAALAACIAKGLDAKDALIQSKSYIYGSILEAVKTGINFK
ncbi:MAG: bifunctional hydroxymethylpyrimidine kinase/phosphomethylpyrimidine kinase, partial [Candidatus Nanoarchaeia archaeon]